MTKSKDTKRQQAELLGMPVGTAERKLRKAVIYELAKQLGKNQCLECGHSISDPEDLAVVHVEDWKDDPDSYFDLANVAFSHASCRARRHGKRQGEKEVSKVEVIVEDSKGNPLRGTTHKGTVYVAGAKDQRYQVRVRNKSGKRLCVVVTVDGRNVMDGEKGSWDGGGLILDPHEDTTIMGWRTSDSEVAAFRLGSKGDSYSAQKGTAENVGVIGVAVFEEKEPERHPITVKETVFVPVVQPRNPFYDPWYVPKPTPFWYGTDTSPIGSTLDSYPKGGGGSGVYGASVSCSTANLSSTSDSVETETSTLRSVALQSHSRRGRPSSTVHTQQLGTEFGEAVASSVVRVKFERATDAPSEVIEIRYDSLSALKKAGIMGRRPSKRKEKKPEAFPDSPGYCAAPPKSRWR